MMKQLPTLLLCAALLAGCGDMKNDAADEKNKLVSKGLEQVRLKKWDDAIRNFEAALADDAKLARPDLELALIYQQQKNNYVRATYHYERYLEKRPDSQKRELINGWIRQAKISFAAEAGQSDGGVSDEMVRLKRENEMLRRQLARGGAPRSTRVKTLLTEPPPSARRASEDKPKRKPAPKPVAAPIAAKPRPTPVSTKPIPRIKTPAPAAKTYQVLPGDTLSKIARTVYGDSSRYKEIFLANQDKMKNENDLRAGEIITIPKLGN